MGVEFQTHPIMNIKRNIIFALESRKKNGVPIVENVPIRMRVIFASQRIEFTTGYRIDVAKWDADKQRVKNGCTNKLKQSAAEINTDLLKYYAEIQNIFKEFEVQEVMPTTQQLKEAFNMRMKDTSEEQPEEAPVSFWEVFDEFVKECGNQNNWTASTYEKFAAVRNHLKEFKEDATFNYFNEFGLNEYVNFLRDTKDMRNSTIGKQMGFLKWFLRWSFKKGHHQNIAYDTFKPKLKTTSKKVIFLTWDELNKLKDYQIPKDKQYLERVRDVFLFCCFTSLRYSDVRNLKRSDVKSDHIEITTVKTADSLTIELNKYSKAILDKYKDIHFENYMALPVISNQKMNDYLKELGELAEINEPVRETYYKGNERIDEVTPKYALLSTHAGRRTFICNALALGIPAQVVMKWTGHFIETDASLSVPTIQSVTNEVLKLNDKQFTQELTAQIQSIDCQSLAITQEVPAQFEDVGKTVSAIYRMGIREIEEVFLTSPIAKINWTSQMTILDSSLPLGLSYWYMKQSVEMGWSSNVLKMQIDSDLYSRQISNNKVNNFTTTLPAPQSDLANYLLKDPYIFDLAGAKEKADERDIEEQLVKHVTRYLLEMGNGFAFVARQKHFQVGNSDFFADLILYSIPLHAYIVVELKATPFKPEYAGQLNFYINVVDDKLRGKNDNKTIGLLLCKGKDEVVAQYALTGYDQPIGISDYQLSKAIPENLKSALPSVEEVEEELASFLDKDNNPQN